MLHRFPMTPCDCTLEWLERHECDLSKLAEDAVRTAMPIFSTFRLNDQPAQAQEDFLYDLIALAVERYFGLPDREPVSLSSGHYTVEVSPGTDGEKLCIHITFSLAQGSFWAKEDL